MNRITKRLHIGNSRCLGKWMASCIIDFDLDGLKQWLNTFPGIKENDPYYGYWICWPTRVAWAVWYE